MENVSCVNCCCSVAKSCPKLWDPMDCSKPGSSVHRVLQTTILQWVTISFRGSSQTRDRTRVSCTGRRFLTTELQGRPFFPLIRIVKNVSCSSPSRRHCRHHRLGLMTQQVASDASNLWYRPEKSLSSWSTALEGLLKFLGP